MTPVAHAAWTEPPRVVMDAAVIDAAAIEADRWASQKPALKSAVRD